MIDRLPPQVTIASRSLPRFSEEEDIHVVSISAPARILVPPDCVAEIFTVPQGTEIKIRFTSKLLTEKEGA